MNKLNEKIGIGISTCNRPLQLNKLILSLASAHSFIDSVVVVNDGNPIDNSILSIEHYIKNNTNLGVAKTKNKALHFLLKNNCDHIFLIEDDIFVKDVDVFNHYISASKNTGIQHFNFSQHGLCNKFVNTDTPNPRIIFDYGSVKIPFFAACVGAFSYYSKQCLEKTGLMDESFYNACEHVEHTHRIHLNNMHPPYWWYPDIENSQNYIGDEPWSLSQSLISSRNDKEQIWAVTDNKFKSLYGHIPRQMPDTSYDTVVKQLKQIKKLYGQN